MYTTRNFRTKKELKTAVAARQAFLNDPANNPPAPAVTYYQAGPFGGNEPKQGRFCAEGPHFPEPHKWYATCDAENGEIVKVS